VSSFYIGYLPKAPSDVSHFLRRIVVALLGAVAGVATLLVISQQRFSPSAFEWQQVRAFEGIIEQNPYPTLLVSRPGTTPPGMEFSRHLLVGVGKHGASSEAARHDGQLVKLQGKLIYRDGQTVIEVMPSSVVAIRTPTEQRTSVREVGPVSLRGEIVDSKCYVGVMNPGQGKVHRDCAVRCISGGIPPALLSSDEHGVARLYLLTTLAGGAIQPISMLSKIGEPVRVSGNLVMQGDVSTIRVSTIERDSVR
jgi:hypothetical protein